MDLLERRWTLGFGAKAMRFAAHLVERGCIAYRVGDRA